MKKQTARIARGDYSGQVHIYGSDELGQLAQAVNNLSTRVQEAQEGIESERRRLDLILAHMSDGVIATDRGGKITIINEMACESLDVTPDEVRGKSILDVLNIRDKYSIRELLESQDELILDELNSRRYQILNANFSLIQRRSGFIIGIVCVLPICFECFA